MVIDTKQPESVTSAEGDDSSSVQTQEEESFKIKPSRLPLMNQVRNKYLDYSQFSLPEGPSKTPGEVFRSPERHFITPKEFLNLRNDQFELLKGVLKLRKSYLDLRRDTL
jgi:hypothetical protein